jgi:hypothetical protein
VIETAHHNLKDVRAALSFKHARAEVLRIENGQILMYVKIRIKGTLKPDWSDWLESLIISNQADGETVLNGHISDQAALIGLLNRIHGLNLQLLSFSQSNQAESPNVKG